MIRRLFVLLIMFNLTGCMSDSYQESGVLFNNSIFAEIIKGKTTDVELKQLLGIPDNKILASEFNATSCLANSKLGSVDDINESVNKEKMIWTYCYHYSKNAKRIFYSYSESYTRFVIVTLQNDIVVNYKISQLQK